MRKLLLLSFLVFISVSLYCQNDPKPKNPPQGQGVIGNQTQTGNQALKPNPNLNLDKAPVFSLDRLRLEFDLNKDGKWSEEETKAFMDQFLLLFKGNHPVKNQLDILFDWNNDKTLDDVELKNARNFFFVKVLGDILEKDKELAQKFFNKAEVLNQKVSEKNPPEKNALNKNPPDKNVPDKNNEIALDQEIKKQLSIFMMEADSVKPGKVKTPLEKGIDTNKDGNLTVDEIQNAKKLLSSAIIKNIGANPKDNKKLIEVGKVKNLLDELADINGDSQIDEVEFKQALKGLMNPHAVQNPFDQALDYNKNGQVEPFEIEKVLSLTRVVSQNEMPLVEGPFKVVTKIDALLDLNADKQVDDNELKTFMKSIVNLGKAENDPKVVKLLDQNKDGMLDQKEVRLSVENLFRPHPVNTKNKIDSELDLNKNNFVETEEIGIAAGFTALGKVFSFDERIERLKNGKDEFKDLKANPELANKTDAKQNGGMNTKNTSGAANTQDKALLSGSTTNSTSAAATTNTTATTSISSSTTGNTSVTSSTTQSALPQLELNLNGKRLAVVSIDDTSNSLASSDKDGIFLFVQNAFINVSGLKIVERQQLGKVLEEIELAMQFNSDDTSVSLEKIEGVDVVVVGVLSHVGSKYYLNLRLISVKDAEILGSSMSNAETEDEFFTMCSDAVIKMF